MGTVVLRPLRDVVSSRPSSCEGVAAELGGRSIFLAGPVWRLDSGGETVVSSDDDDRETGLARLIGERVASIEMPIDTLDLTFEIGSMVLRTFRVGPDDATTVFGPDLAFTSQGGRLMTEPRDPTTA